MTNQRLPPTHLLHYTLLFTSMIYTVRAYWLVLTWRFVTRYLRRRGEVLRLIISLREMLTSPSCRVPGDRRRRTRPEWRSQWQAHRSKTRKCQTPSARQRFLCERHVCHRYTSRAITNMNQNSVSNGQLDNSHSAKLEFSGKLMLLLFFFPQQDIWPRKKIL